MDNNPARTVRAKEQWSQHKLPLRLDGLSFLDVGCYEGDICAEAVRRGAAQVVGIDYTTCADLTSTLAQSSFTFVEIDVMSDKVLEMPEFDIVHAAGVLYHVENPLSFLYRLRKLCHVGSMLHIETSCAVGPLAEHPIMVFHTGDSFDDNPSNWWSPNELCLVEMLTEVGLTDIEVTHSTLPSPTETLQFGRIAVCGRVSNTPAKISQKMLPRRPIYMPQAPGQGNRSHQETTPAESSNAASSSLNNPVGRTSKLMQRLVARARR